MKYRHNSPSPLFPEHTAKSWFLHLLMRPLDSCLSPLPLICKLHKGGDYVHVGSWPSWQHGAQQIGQSLNPYLWEWDWERNMFKTSLTILLHRVSMWELKSRAIQRRATQLKSREGTACPLGWLTLKPLTTLSAGQDGALLKRAPTNPWEGWEPRLIWKAVWHFPMRWNTHLPRGPAIPLLEAYLREMNPHVCTEACVRQFRAALFSPETSQPPTLHQRVTG